MTEAEIEKESPEATEVLKNLKSITIDAGALDGIDLKDLAGMKLEPGRVVEPLALLDERIEVSPFLELRDVFGGPLWIRKSVIVAVKSGVKSYTYRAINEPPPEIACTVYADGREFEVAHDALEVIAELGQGEL